MPRRYRRYYNSENELVRRVIAFLLLFSIYLGFLWKTNRINFWLWVLYGAMGISVIGVIYILWSDFQSNRKRKKIADLLTSIRQAGAETDIYNFINSFGYQKKSEKKLWKQGEYSFTWQQLDIFRKTLHDKGVQISINDHYNDIGLLLRLYIKQKDERFIRESISSDQQRSFRNLNPTNFEVLLCRLYEAMGYSVMKTGKTGDQGCDLVVNMDEQRAVVQAKCYNNESVPNAAIQQAVGALKLYNCTKAFVATNSYFTPEAIQLAKVNNVGLINGERLREMLLQYLKESWS